MAAINRNGEEMTFVEMVTAATTRAQEYMDSGQDGNREFAQAQTALEDAAMRFTRGLAMRQGKFALVDLGRFQSSYHEATSIDLEA